jgi:hypothetical protein
MITGCLGVKFFAVNNKENNFKGETELALFSGIPGILFEIFQI